MLEDVPRVPPRRLDPRSKTTSMTHDERRRRWNERHRGGTAFRKRRLGVPVVQCHSRPIRMRR